MDILKEIVSWAKANAKDGVNIAEFEELVSKAAPPDDSLQAFEWMKKIPALRSALDAALNREFDRATKKYEEEKLPEREKVLREQIRKELNPDETPEQKRIRELEEKLNSKEQAELRTTSQNAMRAKAKEYGIDPEIAKDYAVFGEDADKVLKSHSEWFKAQIDAVKAETARQTFGNKSPTGSGVVTPPTVEEEYNRRLARGDRDGAALIFIQSQNAKAEAK